MGYVYLICDAQSNLYKIGVTTGSIYNRMKKLQTGNGNSLHIVTYTESDYPFKLESLLHARFATKRVMNEWFALSDDEVINFNDIFEDTKRTLDVLLENPFFNKKAGGKPSRL